MSKDIKALIVKGSVVSDATLKAVTPHIAAIGKLFAMPSGMVIDDRTARYINVRTSDTSAKFGPFANRKGLEGLKREMKAATGVACDLAKPSGANDRYNVSHANAITGKATETPKSKEGTTKIKRTRKPPKTPSPSPDMVHPDGTRDDNQHDASGDA